MGLYSISYDGNRMRANKYPLLEFNGFDFLQHYLSYGLFCFHNQSRGGNAIVFNPLRGEVMIPPQSTVSPLQWSAEWGLGFDATTDTYKIVRLFYHDYKNNGYKKMAAEVYSLGTRSWRRISAPPTSDIKKTATGVSAYGDIHWLAPIFYPDESAAECYMVSFDSRKEEFNWTPQPDLKDQVYENFHLLNLRGSLAVVGVLSPIHLEIWVMKDYDTKEWARGYRVSIQRWVKGVAVDWRETSREAPISL